MVERNVKTKRRFPYEQCQWCSGDPQNNKRWYEALERMGPENVRAILAATGYTVGSRADITIGAVQITKGFAQEWLEWRDQQKSANEMYFRNSQVYWTRWAALAATVAAIAAAAGWAFTIFGK